MLALAKTRCHYREFKVGKAKKSKQKDIKSSKFLQSESSTHISLTKIQFLREHKKDYPAVGQLKTSGIRIAEERIKTDRSDGSAFIFLISPSQAGAIEKSERNS